MKEAAQSASVPDVLARGLGRAYGDAAQNDGSGVILTEKLDNFLDFDEKNGVLRAQCGVSFAQIAQIFTPRGWFLPVVPGTKWITLGGAIACDVHGKNHRQAGSLADFLDEIELLTASSEVLKCSRDQNTEVFWATIGGMGLTGIILSAQIRLKPIESALISVNSKRVRGLGATLDELNRAHGDEYCVAWIDALASGENLGRSIVIRGHHASALEAKTGASLEMESAKTKTVPFDFPDFALSALSVKAFNEIYYRAHGDGQSLVNFESFFWPLDAVGGWNKIYGARGFVQYQCVLPREHSLEGFTQILQKISSSGRAAFLGVLKVHGAQNAAPLSFALEGHSLALDLPNAAGTVEFCRELDEITMEFGGRVYLAKDATTTPENLRRMYPRLEEFEKIKAQIDPRCRFQSSLSRRLQIGENL